MLIVGSDRSNVRISQGGDDPRATNFILDAPAYKGVEMMIDGKIADFLEIEWRPSKEDLDVLNAGGNIIMYVGAFDFDNNKLPSINLFTKQKEEI